MQQLSEPLLARTYRLLDSLNPSPSYREIAEGAEVDRNWVAKFVTRAIEEPGVTKVQRVHDWAATRVAQQQQQPAETVDPNHPQEMGSPGNG